MAKIDPADIGRPLTVGEVARRAGVAVSPSISMNRKA